MVELALRCYDARADAELALSLDAVLLAIPPGNHVVIRSSRSSLLPTSSTIHKVRYLMAPPTSPLMVLRLDLFGF